MKIINKLILLVILLFSQSVFSATNNYETKNFCQSVIEEGKKLALDDSGVETSLLVENFVKCNLMILPESISTQIMYSLFGESIVLPLEQVNRFISIIYSGSDVSDVQSFDKNELLSEYKSKTHFFAVIPAALEGFTLASFQIISAMLFVFSLYYLVNTMNEGTFLGNSVNTFWTFTKMSFILLLIFPINSIGLNPVQLFIIFVGFCGTFLASLMWSILPMFKYLYITEINSIDETIKHKADLNALSVAQEMVEANICDISTRQSFLFSDNIENNSEEILASKDFYNCLNSYSDEQNYSLLNISSKELNKTKECLKSDKNLMFNLNCGTIKTTESHTDQTREFFANTGMSEAREIAKKLIGSACLKKTKDENGEVRETLGNEALYYKLCTEVDTFVFSENYKDKALVPSLIKQEEYSKTNYTEDVLKLKENIMTQMKSNVSAEILGDTVVTSELEKKLAYALNKGWINAGTFMFDVGESTTFKTSSYEKIMDKYSFASPSFSFTDKQMEIVENARQIGAVNNLVSKYENIPIRGYISSDKVYDGMLDIFTLNSNLKEMGITNEFEEGNLQFKDYKDEYITDADVSLLNKLMFPTLIILKEFIEPIDAANSSDTCTDDYSKCKIMPVNPIATIVESGRSVVSNSGKILTVTGVLSHMAEKRITKAKELAERKDNSLAESRGTFFAKSSFLILKFLSLFMSANLILGLLLGYILPIVLFIYFIGNAVSWITTLAFTVAGAPLWMAMHLLPSKEEGFAGHGKRGYVMVMDIFLKPTFIVVGVFGAFILSTIMVVILNTTFEIVMRTFMFFDDPSSVTELFYNFLLNMIYMIFLSVIFFRSAKAVYKIPNSLEKWVGMMAYEEAGMWREITSLINKTFFSSVKRYLIFT